MSLEKQEQLNMLSKISKRENRHILKCGGFFNKWGKSATYFSDGLSFNHEYLKHLKR